MSGADEASLAGYDSGVPGETPWSLVERAQRGDRESRERLCRLYGRLVWTIYLSKIPEQDRMDLCQEVFRTVFQRLGEFKKSPDDGPRFRAWLRKIAYHKSGNYIKGSRRQGQTVSNSEIDSLIWDDGNGSVGDDRSNLLERSELVQGAFDEAAAQFQPRTVLAARKVVFEGKPVEIVAAELKMSRRAVHIAKSRVLARIRAILRELGEDIVSGSPAP